MIINLPKLGPVQFADDLSEEDFQKQLQALSKKYDFKLPKPEVGLGTLFKQGLMRGIGQTGIAFGDVGPAMLASFTGFPEYAEQQMQEAAETQQKLQREYPTQFKSYTEIESPYEALQYGAETLGEVTPSIGTSIISGGLGGVGARALATRGVGQALAARAAEKELTEEATKKLVERGTQLLVPQISKTARQGMYGGTFFGSFAQNAPEVFQNIYEETGEFEPVVSALAGSISAVLDSFVPASILNKFGSYGRLKIIEKLAKESGAAPKVWKAIGKEAAKAAAGEGVTESVQEAISAAAEEIAGSAKGLFDPENIQRYKEAFVKGAVGGAGFGSISGLRRGLVEREAYKKKFDGEQPPPAAEEVPPTAPTGVPTAPTTPPGVLTPEAEEKAITDFLEQLNREAEAEAAAQAAPTEGAPSVTGTDEQAGREGVGVSGEGVVVPPTGTAKPAEPDRVDTAGGNADQLAGRKTEEPSALGDFLAPEKYYYHAVRNVEDIPDILKNEDTNQVEVKYDKPTEAAPAPAAPKEETLEELETRIAEEEAAFKALEDDVESMARANADAAFDQIRQYENLDDAIGSTRDNVVDTFNEYYSNRKDLSGDVKSYLNQRALEAFDKRVAELKEKAAPKEEAAPTPPAPTEEVAALETQVKNIGAANAEFAFSLRRQYENIKNVIASYERNVVDTLNRLYDKRKDLSDVDKSNLKQLALEAFDNKRFELRERFALKEAPKLTEAKIFEVTMSYPPEKVEEDRKYIVNADSKTEANKIARNIASDNSQIRGRVTFKAKEVSARKELPLTQAVKGALTPQQRKLAEAGDLKGLLQNLLDQARGTLSLGLFNPARRELALILRRMLALDMKTKLFVGDLSKLEPSVDVFDPRNFTYTEQKLPDGTFAVITREGDIIKSGFPTRLDALEEISKLRKEARQIRKSVLYAEAPAPAQQFFKSVSASLKRETDNASRDLSDVTYALDGDSPLVDTAIDLLERSAERLAKASNKQTATINEIANIEGATEVASTAQNLIMQANALAEKINGIATNLKQNPSVAQASIAEVRALVQQLQAFGETKTKPSRVFFDGKRGGAYNESVSASIKRLDEDSDVLFDEPDLKGAVYIAGIDRQAGGQPKRASEVIRALTDWADANNETLALMPAGAGSLSNADLRAWYERNGFTVRPSGYMVRTPKILELPKAGVYSPITDTIGLDSNNGMNVHTVVHEGSHAVLSHTLDNPNHPVTKEVTNLYNQMKASSEGAYGATDVQEFAAEAWGNPEFREHLKQFKPTGQKLDGWKRLINAVRRLFGLGSHYETAYDKIDNLLSQIMSPAPESRGGDTLYAESTSRPDAAHTIFNWLDSGLKKIPSTFTPERRVRMWGMLEKLAVPARALIYKTLTASQLGEVATKYFKGNSVKFANLLNEMEGYKEVLREKLEPFHERMVKHRNENPERHAILSDLINQSTLENVAPYPIGRDSATGEMRVPQKYQGTEKEIPWRELVGRFMELTPQEQKLFKDNFDTFAALRAEFKKSLALNIRELVGDNEKALSLYTRMMNELAEVMIENYSPLYREGGYRLAYSVNNIPRVERFATQAERAAAQERLAAEGATDFEATSEIDQYTARTIPDGTMLASIVKIMRDAGAKDTDLDKLTQLIVSAFPETSYLKRAQRRAGIGGYVNDNAAHVFDRVASNTVRQVANTRYRQRIRNVLNLMEEDQRKLTGDASEDAKAMYNDFNGRFEFSLNPNIAGWAQNTSSAAFYWNLGANTSSAIVQVATLPTIVYPIIGGKYGWGTAWNAIKKAMALYSRSGTAREIVELTGEKSTQRAMLSIENLTNAGAKEAAQYTDLIEALKLYGLLTNSTARDALYSESQDASAFGGVNRIGRKVALYSSFLFHHTERMSREVTAIATYDLELAKQLERLGKNKKLTPEQVQEQAKANAIQEAIRVTERTHGASNTLTGPALGQSNLGKVLMVFKRFAFAQYYNLFSTIFRAFPVAGASETELEDIRAARRQLTGIYVMAALLAGAKGIPLYWIAALAYNALNDDDDEDFDAVARRFLGEFLFKGPVNYITNLNIADRVGWSDLIWRENKNDRADSSAITQYLEALLGAPFSILKNVEKGLKLIAEGQFYRGAEMMLPAAIKNVMKGARYGFEGANTLRGDAVMGDISGYNAAMQVLGFAPADLMKQYEENAYILRRQKAITGKEQQLLKRYYIALRQYDFELAQDLREKLFELGDKYPELGINDAMLNKSVKARDRVSDKMYHGVQLNEKLRARLEGAASLVYD